VRGWCCAVDVDVDVDVERAGRDVARLDFFWDDMCALSDVEMCMVGGRSKWQVVVVCVRVTDFGSSGNNTHKNDSSLTPPLSFTHNHWDQ